MKIHKLTKSSTEAFGFTECGKNLTFSGGQGSKDWEDVDCKVCLKKEPYCEKCGTTKRKGLCLCEFVKECKK